MAGEKKAVEPHQIVDDPSAPMVYVEGCIGGGGSGPNLMLTFAARAVDHSGPEPRPYLLTNLRMMIPAEGAKGLADFINGILTPPAPEDISPDRSIQ